MSAGAALVNEQITGCQTPRILVYPSARVGTAADEVIALADEVGLILDPWQRLCLDVILSEDANGDMAALIAALIVPRQNGKGAVLEALELGWLFLWRVPLILHSAHLFKTSQEAFKRLVRHIRNTPWLDDQVAAYSFAHGKEGIRLKPNRELGETDETAPRIEFVARSKGSGRGFSANRLVLDEAYDLPDLELDAAMPTLSAQQDIQILYTSSAPMVDSLTLRRVRRRMLAGDGEDLAGLEWSVDPQSYALDSERDVATANPGYGYRIRPRTVRTERKTMSEAGFARERLGVPDEATAASPFDMSALAAAESDEAAPGQRVVFGVDAAPEGADAAIFAADGKAIEIVDVRAGTGWVAERIVELSRKHRADVVLDPAGPAGALVPHLAPKLGKRLRLTGARDVVHACGVFDQDLRDGRLRVRRSAALRSAMESARKRRVGRDGDAWTLRRVENGSSIAPIMAALLAHWGATNRPPRSVADQVF